MNLLLEPFVYEMVAERQNELRESAARVGKHRLEVPRVWRVLCCRRGDRVLATPCFTRLLGAAR